MKVAFYMNCVSTHQLPLVRMEEAKMLYAEMGRELPRFVSLRVFVVWVMMNVRWRLRG